MPSPSAPVQAEQVLNNLRRHRKGLEATLDQMEALPAKDRSALEFRREARELSDSAKRASQLSARQHAAGPGKG